MTIVPLPRGSGGRRRIRGLLCVNCNSVAGARWDSELVKQLKPLALLFGVQRQDGEETPPAKFETTDGRELWLNADGSMNPAAKPFSRVPRGDSGPKIQITPRSIEDARKILKGIAAKYLRAMSLTRLPQQDLSHCARSPTAIGIRAARTAGNKPPTRPMVNAHVRPSHSSAGDTSKANTIWPDAPAVAAR